MAFVLIPAFYRSRVTSIYELLGTRFGPSSRHMASWTFMIGRIFASGARLYAGAVPASMILFGDIKPGHVAIGVVIVACLGVLYTITGGIRSVIWTDVIQAGVFVGAAMAACWVLLDRIPIGAGEIMEALRHPAPGEPSKLKIITIGIDHAQNGGLTGIDFSQFYTLITACTGLVLFNIAAYGTDQDLVQRTLTCGSARSGSRSAIAGVFIGIPVTFLFMVVGLLLFIYYRRPDLMGDAAPGYAPDADLMVFLTFILQEIPPGLTGLMMAGLFAAGISSINSALNAMSSTFVTDCYRVWRPDRNETHYVTIGRLAVGGWGVVLAAFAIVCIYWSRSDGGTLIDFALSVMTFAYSGLLAVFLTAILTKRGNEWSVAAALATGFIVVLLLQPWSWTPWTGENSIAFPWRMLIATGLAFAVCFAGPPRNRTSAANSHS